MTKNISNLNSGYKTIINDEIDSHDLVSAKDVLISEVDFDVNAHIINTVNRLDKNVEAINKNLVPTPVSIYNTENNEYQFDCSQNGYIDNIRIKGKSYRNFWQRGGTWIISSDESYAYLNNDVNTSYGTFTVINTSDKIIKIEEK